MCRLISWYFPRSSGVTMPPYVPAEKSWKYGNLDAPLGWVLISINYLLIYLLIYLYLSAINYRDAMTSSYTGKFYVFPPRPASAWTSHKSIIAGSWESAARINIYICSQPVTLILNYYHLNTSQSVTFCQTFFWTNRNWLRSFNFPLNGDKSASAD